MCIYRTVKQLQAEVKACSLCIANSACSVSTGITALVLDVCGVLKHFDQVRLVLVHQSTCSLCL
jgi:hypothetical protein